MIILSPLVSMALFVIGCSTLAFSQSRPNIVLIMTDDQGYGDLGVHGNPILDTPNLDLLASESSTMDNFYVSPVCTPTRASLMTGRYHYRTRAIDTFKGRAMMDTEEVTIAEVLGDSGYRTGIFGKWHLGDNYPLRPTEQGFQESLVHRGSGLGDNAGTDPIENQYRYTDPILFHNNRQVQTKGYCTDVYFDASFDFIDQSLKAKKPFFAYIAPNAPHFPFHDVPEDLYRKYKSKNLSPVLFGGSQNVETTARVFAMIENIDQNVGRLLKHLDKRRAARNTIVIFMTDNGPSPGRYVGPFRGAKTQVHEGGIRSPFLMRWPAQLKAGSHSDRISAHIDVMPTLLEAAQVAIPGGLRLDGLSFLPLLNGKSNNWPERTLILQSHRGDVPTPLHHIAVREQRWKLVHPSGFAAETMPQGVPFELYDLESDPGESNNLYNERPEVAKRLQQTYDRWFADVSQTRADNFAPPRIVLGTPHETRTTLSWQDCRNTENGGEWLLQFEGSAEYDIEFLWDKPIIGSLTIELQIGDLRETLTVESLIDIGIIHDLAIPEGKAALSFKITKGNPNLSPYHLVLVKK